MGQVKITDNTRKFDRASDRAWEMSLNHMAIDIVRLSQMQVPHDTGRLQSSKSQRQINSKTIEIRYQTNYAEMTHENKKGIKFRKGRKDHYLSDPGHQVAQNRHSYLDEAMIFIRGAM